MLSLARNLLKSKALKACPGSCLAFSRDLSSEEYESLNVHVLRFLVLQMSSWQAKSYAVDGEQGCPWRAERGLESHNWCGHLPCLMATLNTVFKHGSWRPQGVSRRNHMWHCISSSCGSIRPSDNRCDGKFGTQPGIHWNSKLILNSILWGDWWQNVKVSEGLLTKDIAGLLILIS